MFKKQTLSLQTVGRWASGAGVVLLLLAAGCGSDSTKPDQTPGEFAPPTNLTAVNGHNVVDLSWSGSPDASGSDFKGYAVYRYTSTMIGATPAQLASYRRNPTFRVTTTSFRDTTNADGTKYYYAVRGEKNNGDLSQPTNEINTASRSQGGPVTISEFQFSGEPSGLELSTGTAYSMSSSGPDNRPHIDLYLGTDDPNDATSAGLALKSPSLVENSDPDWADRAAEFKELASWDDYTTDGATGWSSKVVLGANPVGKVFAVRTPAVSGQRHYGKVEINLVSGAAGERQVELNTAWQSLPDYIRFRAAR